MTNKFTVVTYNVHEWKTTELVDNVKSVSSLLASLNADLICLQEVSYDRLQYNELKYVTKELKMEIAFGPSWCAYSVNAVLSKFPIQSFENYFCEETFNPRGMLHVKLGSPAPPIFSNVYTTHLDYRAEEDRIVQLDYFFNVAIQKKKKQEQTFTTTFSSSEAALLGEGGEDDYHLIVGDFNSLCEKDYSSQFLKEKVIQVRKKNKWETAKFDVYNKMLENGYSDAYYMDPKNQSRANPRTCDYETRIDYIWASKALASKIKNVKCKAVPSAPSDHYPVVATFEY